MHVDLITFHACEMRGSATPTQHLSTDTAQSDQADAAKDMGRRDAITLAASAGARRIGRSGLSESLGSLKV